MFKTVRETNTSRTNIRNTPVSHNADPITTHDGRQLSMGVGVETIGVARRLGVDGIRSGPEESRAKAINGSLLATSPDCDDVRTSV